jgi:phosphinothricin acetyltransferase
VDIRPARADDFDAIASITNHYIATTAIHFGDTPVTGADLRAQWDGKTFPWVVADVRTGPGRSGSILGYAKAGTWRDRAAYRWTVETGLYVAHDARGRRIGTALYGALLDACRAGGYRTAVAGITLPNEASVRLHERLGFRAVGVFREVGFKLDAWHDVGFWQLLLACHGATATANRSSG